MRRSRARDQRLKEQQIEFLLWKRWRHERLDALLNGAYGAAANDLLEFLKTMQSPSQLIAFIDGGPWARADRNTRFKILALLDAVIIKQREKRNLDPFDDALPGQPDNVFLILRAKLSDEFPNKRETCRTISGELVGASNE